MLFCCLWRNVETSWHKHFVFLSRHKQTPPLTTSGRPLSVRSHRWQHAVKPSIGSESQFMYCNSPVFDAPVRVGWVRRNIPHNVWHWKTRMVWLPASEKCFEDMVTRFNRDHECDVRADRQTDTTWRHRPRLHSIARQKSLLKFKMADGGHLKKSFFDHYSTADFQISVKFCVGKQFSIEVRHCDRYPRSAEHFCCFFWWSLCFGERRFSCRLLYTCYNL